jgi:hypothetical protein
MPELMKRPNTATCGGSKSFKSGQRSYPAFFMSGNGGNKVVAIPALDIAVVITSTNYNTHGMHEQTERILTDYVLAAVD